ncbi:MAG: acyl-CoA dehydrogenase family protein [Actinomycetota bacterium]
MIVSAEDLAVVGDVVRRFGEHVETTLFGAEGPDGDLGAVPKLLRETADMDLLADPNPGNAGHDAGVWGRHALESGAALSLVTLSTLAETCAGFAAAVHAQGIGCLALDGESAEGAIVGAAFMPPLGIPLDERTAPDVCRVQEDGTLHGTAHFVTSAGAPESLACFARAGDGWALATVGADAEGVRVQDVGARVGVRAMTQSHITFDRAAATVLRRGPAASDLLRRVVACDWLGQATIAAGAARRALRDAQTYAEGRYQGGSIIVEHAAVRLLLAHARHDVEVMTSVLGARAHEPLATIDATALLRWAISARLCIGEHARRAVTSSLQVLGGYGYMDDYGQSKRLRDVSALASMHGGRDQLLLLLQDLAKDAR